MCTKSVVTIVAACCLLCRYRCFGTVPHHTSAGFRSHPAQQQQQQQQQQQPLELAITPSDTTTNHYSAATIAAYSAYDTDSYDVLAQSPLPCSALAGSLRTVEVPVGVSAKHGKLCKGRSLHTPNSSSTSCSSSSSGDCAVVSSTAAAVVTTAGYGTSDAAHRSTMNNSYAAAAAAQQPLHKQSLALCASPAPCRGRRATTATAGGYTAAAAADASARDWTAQAAKIAAKRSQRKVLQLPAAMCTAAAAVTPAQARAAQLAAAAKHSSGVGLAHGWRSAPGVQLQLDCGVGAGTRDVRMFAGRAVSMARNFSAESTTAVPSSA
jgi:hypothetical protein